MNPFIITLINPGGITETYKFILESQTYFKDEDLTLKTITSP